MGSGVTVMRMLLADSAGWHGRGVHGGDERGVAFRGRSRPGGVGAAADPFGSQAPRAASAIFTLRSQIFTVTYLDSKWGDMLGQCCFRGVIGMSKRRNRVSLVSRRSDSPRLSVRILGRCRVPRDASPAGVSVTGERGARAFFAFGEFDADGLVRRRRARGPAAPRAPRPA
ncbi:hypothetical protein GCM10017600_55060 [Streptosporangium carneum]|uniref:Uncharacterized protein n=1 Tax=Streptosporangium carneum TaxID=47481 RepID=A0A9W6I6J9_9ACTN|nr:hypothetical protein GCM10017600_55060 [Streptosporangium carneum]